MSSKYILYSQAFGEIINLFWFLFFLIILSSQTFEDKPNFFSLFIFSIVNKQIDEIDKCTFLFFIWGFEIFGILIIFISFVFDWEIKLIFFPFGLSFFNIFNSQLFEDIIKFFSINEYLLLLFPFRILYSHIFEEIVKLL